MAKAINVTVTMCSIPYLPRHEMLAWVNSSLQSQFTKIDELRTGAAYCQFMDMLFPNSVNLQKIKYMTNIEYEFMENFKLLQAAFNKMSVERSIPFQRLIKGHLRDNLEFLQWFKKFFDANYKGREYDAMAVRHGAPMGYGTAKAVKSRSAPSATPVSPRKQVIAKVLSRDDNKDQEECRVSSEVDVELMEMSDKLGAVSMSLSPDQQGQGSAVVQPQVEEQTQLNEVKDFSQPSGLDQSLPETSVIDQVAEGSNRQTEMNELEEIPRNLKEQRDLTDKEMIVSTGTERGSGSPVDDPQNSDPLKLEKLKLERKVEITELEKSFYYNKCLALETLCYHPGRTNNQEILHVLYERQTGFYPPSDSDD